MLTDLDKSSLIADQQMGRKQKGLPEIPAAPRTRTDDALFSYARRRIPLALHHRNGVPGAVLH